MQQIPKVKMLGKKKIRNNTVMRRKAGLETPSTERVPIAPTLNHPDSEEVRKSATGSCFPPVSALSTEAPPPAGAAAALPYGHTRPPEGRRCSATCTGLTEAFTNCKLLIPRKSCGFLA